MAGKSTVLDGYDYKNLMSMIQRFKSLPLKKEIIEAFVDLDTNHSGRISRTELRNGLAKKFQVDVTEAEMDSLFKHIDKTGVSGGAASAHVARA
jgi:Ca2+-binding EF-hand superfamily protein